MLTTITTTQFMKMLPVLPKEIKLSRIKRGIAHSKEEMHAPSTRDWRPEYDTELREGYVSAINQQYPLKEQTMIKKPKPGTKAPKPTKKC